MARHSGGTAVNIREGFLNEVIVHFEVEKVCGIVEWKIMVQ